jgi:hypothetical protein
MSPDPTNESNFERLPDGDLSSGVEDGGGIWCVRASDTDEVVAVVARSDATEWENIVPFERPTETEGE